jgi:hypothetical protein
MTRLLGLLLIPVTTTLAVADPAVEDLGWTNRRTTYGVTASMTGDDTSVAPIVPRELGLELDVSLQPWLYASATVGTINFEGLATSAGLHLRHRVKQIAVSLGGGLGYTGAHTSHDEKAIGSILTTDNPETIVTDYAYQSTGWANLELGIEGRSQNGITVHISAGVRRSIAGGGYTCMETDSFKPGSESCTGTTTFAPYVGVMVGHSL